LKGLDQLKQAVSSGLLSEDEILEAINIAQTNADFQDALQNMQPLNDWAQQQYTKLLKGTCHNRH